MHYIKYLHYFQSLQLSKFWYLHFSWLKALSGSVVQKKKKKFLNLPWGFKLAHRSGENLFFNCTAEKYMRQMEKK